jgi:hypothetical protein
MLKRDGIWFKDEHGRTLLLRGVNLGGNTKYPTQPDGRTHLAEGFFNHREVSFVGRPFAIKEADEHFERLSKWGLSFLRFLITWEAIEHANPGTYDQEYLDYLEAIVEKAQTYNFKMFIDPHQDVWSRFTGGDGAPGWTLEAVGFDITKFKDTHAAIVHQTYGDPFPKMVWANNYSRLATATMFTLFFAGNHFAPNTQVGGVPVQEYLQGHYCRAIQEVAKRLKNYSHVVGYDTLNEPSTGYIGAKNANQLHMRLKNGVTPTPYQAMLLGSGFAQMVEEWGINVTGNNKKGDVHLSTGGTNCWQEGHKCIWRNNGVWDIDKAGDPHLLRADHFAMIDGQEANFTQQALIPFINKFAHSIHEIDPKALIFFEGDALNEAHAPQWSADDANNIVYAPHWYDALTLLTKRYIPFLGFNNHTAKPVVGLEQVRNSFIDQIRVFREHGKEIDGGIPTLIGEIGIPYDMNDRSAYRTSDFSAQEQALDASINAVEQNFVAFTLWNYTANNTNERGDGWNGEDLSIFSVDQQKNKGDIHSGGRALKALVRPYAMTISGEPIRTKYDYRTAEFEFVYRHEPNLTEPTVFFIPSYQYPHGFHVEISDGHFEIDSAKQQLLYWHSSREMPHFVKVSSANPRQPANRPTLARILVGGAALFLFWRWLNRKK